MENFVAKNNICNSLLNFEQCFLLNNFSTQLVLIGTPKISEKRKVIKLKFVGAPYFNFILRLSSRIL